MPAKEVRSVEVAGRTVDISNPDKVYFPELGATKFDLVSYYLDVAEALGVTAFDRPAMLQRFPDGAAGKSFFQKRVPNGAPDWLQTTTVTTPNGTTSNALVLADLAHVVWAVNLGCLGLHLWPYRVDDPEHADELRIDLDPQPGTAFDEIRAAGGLRADPAGRARPGRLPEDHRQPGPPHLRPPRARGGTAIAVRSAAVALARELERRHPDLVTANWWKEERGERIFVDFNQNAPHKTVFGAWFVRPRVGGQVSTPLTWDEIDTVDPDGLTIRTVPDRLAERGDPWAAIADRPQSLQPLLDLAEQDRANGLHDAPWPPEYPKQPDEPTRVAPSRAKKA